MWAADAVGGEKRGKAGVVWAADAVGGEKRAGVRGCDLGGAETLAWMGWDGTGEHRDNSSGKLMFSRLSVS
ncbi:hypothetical protein DWZ60_10360 [Blautia sp. AF34-10]|nr:hypothetical protein DWZ60_10360 [Blautia sp. AF34-10]